MNENENSEQMQETEAEQQAIDYKTETINVKQELEKANETIKKLKLDIFTARHNIEPEYSELIYSTFNKLVNADTNQEKALEVLHQMYPNAFLPTFSVHTEELSKAEKEKSSFLSGLNGKIPLQ